MVRRTLRTKLTLPDKTVTYPGKNLPPMIVRTEEVFHHETQEDLVYNHGYEMARNTFSPNKSGDAPDITQSQQSQPSNGQSGSLNFAAYRQGVLGAHDSRNIPLLQKDVRDVFGDEEVVEEIRKFGAERFQTDSEARRDAAKSKGQPKIGVKHVRKMIQEDLNGGA